MLLHEESRQGLVMFAVQKGITQAWKFANETEVFLLERTNDHVQINVIGIIELLSLFKR